MKKLLGKTLCLIIAFCMLISCIPAFAAVSQESKPTIFVIGDSTGERNIYDAENTQNRTGWGQVLYNYFKDTCTVSNWALSGESTRRLYNTWWSSIIGKISAGDYVLIQLGHNDIATETDSDGNYVRYADPIAEEKENKAENEYVEYSYKWFLKYYIDAIRAKNAYPILVTSVERQWEAFYKETESQLYNYVNAMKKVGNVENVPVIDVWTDFRTELINMGETDSLSWFIADKVHLNRIGAMTTAKIFAENLQESTHEDAIKLAEYLVDDISAVTDKGSPAAAMDEDFNGDYADRTKIVTKYADWSIENNGYAIQNKDIVLTKQTADRDFAATFTSRKVTAEEKSTYGDAYTASMVGYLFRHKLEQAVTSGYLKYSFKLKASSESESIAMRVGGFGGEISIDATTYTKDAWHTFDIYLDVANGKVVMFADGGLYKDTYSSNTTGLSELYFGLVRTTDVDAEISLDDISLEYIDEDTFNGMAGILPDGTLIYDNFERYSETLTGWTVDNADSANRKFEVWKDSVTGNKALRCWANSADSSSRRFITRTFEKQSGYLHLTYRICNNCETSERFRMRVGDAEFEIMFNTSAVLGKSITGTSSALPVGTWYTLDFYFDIANSRYAAYVDGQRLLSETAYTGMGDCDSIDFSWWRQLTGTKAADMFIDDLKLETITSAEYDAALKLPADTLISEGFAFGTIGAAISSPWNGWTSSDSYGTNSDIVFATDPADSKNSVVNFVRRIQNLRAWHTITYSFDEALTDGVYSMKFRVRSEDTDGDSFCLNVSDDAGKSVQTQFMFNSCKVSMPSWYDNSGVKTASTANENYGFSHNKWFDIELIFDLSGEDGESAVMTVYVGDTKVIDRRYLGLNTADSSNNGTVKSVAFMIHPNTASNVITEPTTDNPVLSSVLLDDITMRSLSSGVVEVVKSGGVISAVKVNAGWELPANNKFIVAVYNSENGVVTGLKNAEIIKTSVRGNNQTLPLNSDIAVDETDIVKVYFWNMDILKPLDGVF